MVIIRGCGNIGKKHKIEWPDAISIDRIAEADFVFDLCELGVNDSRFHDFLKKADIVIHLATSANPEDPDAVHFQALENSAKLTNACAKAGVKKLRVFKRICG